MVQDMQQQGRGGSSYISHPKWHGSSFKVTTYGRQTSKESFNEADTSNNNNFSIYFFLYLSFFEIRPQGIMHISHRVLIICANEIQLNPDIIVEHLVLVIKLFWHSGYDYASSNSVLLPQKAAAKLLESSSGAAKAINLLHSSLRKVVVKNKHLTVLRSYPYAWLVITFSPKVSIFYATADWILLPVSLPGRWCFFQYFSRFFLSWKMRLVHHRLLRH